MRSSEPQGSFSSASLDLKNASFEYELNLPDNIRELVGEGKLVISVETNGNWSFFAPKNKTLLYKEKLNASAAEEFCVNQGGHLASVGSEEDQKELDKVAGRKPVWLGGRRKEGGDEWEWLDGSPWLYQNWQTFPEFGIYGPNTDQGYDCMDTNDGHWFSTLCRHKKYFICVNHPIKMTGNHNLVFKSPSLVNQELYFCWNDLFNSFNNKLMLIFETL